MNLVNTILKDKLKCYEQYLALYEKQLKGYCRNVDLYSAIIIKVKKDISEVKETIR